MGTQNEGGSNSGNVALLTEAAELGTYAAKFICKSTQLARK